MPLRTLEASALSSEGGYVNGSKWMEKIGEGHLTYIRVGAVRLDDANIVLSVLGEKEKEKKVRRSNTVLISTKS